MKKYGYFEIASPIGSYLVTQLPLNGIVFLTCFPLTLLTCDTVPVTLSAGPEKCFHTLFLVFPTLYMVWTKIDKYNCTSISNLYCVH